MASAVGSARGKSNNIFSVQEVSPPAKLECEGIRSRVVLQFDVEVALRRHLAR